LEAIKQAMNSITRIAVLRRVLTIGTALLTAAGNCRAEVPLQVRLGFPADAKLLILNADDLAMAHSEDAASFEALEHKWVTSGTVMVPCPWFTEVAAYAKAHPEADLGLHLTLTSEWDTYRWGPVAFRASVPSLVDANGYFYPDQAQLVAHAKPQEVEIELRAQIDRAKAMGLEPSHLDAHMHTLYTTPELFSVFLKVGRAYNLPIRMARNNPFFQARLGQIGPEDLIPDAIFSPEADVSPSRWLDYYLDVIKNLQAGVTEIFVHLARDDAESRAIMINHADWGAAWRQRELYTVSNPAFRRALENNHVTLIGWRDLKRLLQQDTASRAQSKRPAGQL
jgi:chitin disaccharide deacetylase